MSGNHSASDVSCPAEAQLRPAPPCSTASPSSSLNRPVSASGPGRLSGGRQTLRRTPVKGSPTGVMEVALGGVPETSPEDALTASVVTAERPRLLVEVSSPSGGGSAIVVALADTGATTSLITRESASRIRLCVREADIELTGLNGVSSTVGESWLWLQVSGVEKKQKVRTIVVERLPEGQDMLLACKDLKMFGLIHPEFPKPYAGSGESLRLPPSSGRVKHGYRGGNDLRRTRSLYPSTKHCFVPMKKTMLKTSPAWTVCQTSSETFSSNTAACLQMNCQLITK